MLLDVDTLRRNLERLDDDITVSVLSQSGLHVLSIADLVLQ